MVSDDISSIVKPGRSYLLNSDGDRDLIVISGLCVDRKPLIMYRDRGTFQDAGLINSEGDSANEHWITTNQVRDINCISPTSITRIAAIIDKYITDSDKGLVILDGIEYLITQNAYRAVLNLLQLLNDKIMISTTNLLVRMDPEAMDKIEYKNIAREIKPLEIK